MRLVESQLRQLIRGILREEAGPGKSLELIARLEQINSQLTASEQFRDRDTAEIPKFGIGLSIEGGLTHVGFAVWNVELPEGFHWFEAPGGFHWSTLERAEKMKVLLGGIEVPHGKIRLGPQQNRSRGQASDQCLGAWSVWNTFDTTSGWGPLLYDLAIEVATERAGGLTPDRESVSKDARAVWTTYDSSRPDVAQAQLDISDTDIKKWKTVDLAHLTPDVAEDDCNQTSSLFATWQSDAAWHESPLSRAYRKPPTTLAALRSLGLFREG